MPSGLHSGELSIGTDSKLAHQDEPEKEARNRRELVEIDDFTVVRAMCQAVTYLD
jgi:hypothetical protein